MQKIKNFLKCLNPVKSAEAHCDVPCGIYDMAPSQIAAATVLKMTQKIGELAAKDANDTEARNSFVRYVLTKEEHARKCKEELLILWTDYFKPEHLTKFPDLHERFWQAAKLCSKVKQTVDVKAAYDLAQAVKDIAAIFEKTR